MPIIINPGTPAATDIIAALAAPVKNPLSSSGFLQAAYPETSL